MQTDVCIRCNEPRPLAEFRDAGANQACRACRKDAMRSDLPAPVDWGSTPAKFRKAIRAHLEAPPGTPFSQIAREVGLSAHWGLETILARSADARRVYKQLLSDAGLDLPYMVQKLRLNLHAQRPIWNPKTEEFELFPDTTTQQRALELLHKLHGVIGNDGKDSGPRAPTIVVLTNIGEGEPEKLVSKARTYELAATAVPAEEADVA